ncbi:hypothetical protein, partial [Roseateles koreensis]
PSRTPRNQYRLDIFLGVPTIGIHPKSPVFMRVGEVLQVRLTIEEVDWIIKHLTLLLKDAFPEKVEK